MAADSAASSNTSTSHTLSAGSGTIMAAAPPSALLEALQPDNRHKFLTPTADIPNDGLEVAKKTLEAFAGRVSDQQLQKLKESRKRKRGGDEIEVLKLRKVYVDGFETNQVWKQAERIIASVLGFAEDRLGEMEERNEIISEDAAAAALEEGDDDEELELGSDEELVDEDEEEGFGDEDEELVDEDDLDEQEFDEAPEDDDAQVDDEDDDDAASQASYEADPDGLNDGFFSLEEFNRQSQFFEEQDAKGDPNTDQASDDEAIDWDADPNAPAAGKPKASNKDAEDDEDQEADSDDEDNGPTFGDMALDAPEGDSEDEFGGDIDPEAEEEENNANGIFYKDFFAPPARKRTGGPRPPKHMRREEPQPEDMERAMADVKRDLFDDESEVSDSDDALSDVSAGDPKARRSAHERRQAKLAEEIRKLEAASVAKREWTLSGEATAAERPSNSLLEQDLDFEYVGKPVPVITPEVSESIEDLIKRRILAQEFDEVIRRRPDAEDSGNARRGMLAEVDDTKSSKGLGELYEEDHVKKNNPDTYVSAADDKTAKEEKEIEAMWRDVSARLDALSSWHYKPKPVAPTLSVVADVATIAMEDAQPATAQAIAGESSRMAPQEVYSASNKDAAPGEKVGKSGLPTAKAEMSREDKTRQRRRHKERVRKAGGTGPNGSRATVSKKAQTIADLKKGGVKVINRKGEITDVDGNKIKAAKAASSTSFKL